MSSVEILTKDEPSQSKPHLFLCEFKLVETMRQVDVALRSDYARLSRDYEELCSLFDFTSSRSKDIVEDLKLALISDIDSIDHDRMLAGCKLV